MVVRVYIDEEKKTIIRMYEMFNFLLEEFGEPGDDESLWTYGKSKDWVGSTMCSGPSEIEFLDFVNEEDAVAFKLKWQQ